MKAFNLDKYIVAMIPRICNEENWVEMQNESTNHRLCRVHKDRLIRIQYVIYDKRAIFFTEKIETRYGITEEQLKKYIPYLVQLVFLFMDFYENGI